jgi:hypothetical protein
MSDVDQEAYWDTRSTKKSRALSATAHKRNVEHFGSEGAYVEAHALNVEAPPAGRTFVSFTTDPKVAEYFARGGSVYTARVPLSDVLFQTVQGGGESEVLVRGRVRAQKR